MPSPAAKCKFEQQWLDRYGPCKSLEEIVSMATESRRRKTGWLCRRGIRMKTNRKDK